MREDSYHVGGLPGAEEGPYHALGHIDGAGMEWLIETLKPSITVPVHTPATGVVSAAVADRVIQAEYAAPVEVS